MRLVLIFTILAAGGCSGWSARRAVLRGNKAIYDGIRTRDVTLLAQWVAPDLRYHTADGKTIDRDEWLAAVKSTPGEILSVGGLGDPRFEPPGDRLTLCGLQCAVVRLEGKELIDDGAFCSDWQKRDC